MDEDPAFLDRGKPVSRRGLEEMLRFTAKQMLDENARISRMLIISIPEHRFYHGPVTVDGNAGNFFFFEDAQMGLMSIVVSKTGETRMARIAAVPQPMKSDD